MCGVDRRIMMYHRSCELFNILPAPRAKKKMKAKNESRTHSSCSAFMCRFERKPYVDKTANRR